MALEFVETIAVIACSILVATYLGKKLWAPGEPVHKGLAGHYKPTFPEPKQFQSVSECSSCSGIMDERKRPPYPYDWGEKRTRPLKDAGKISPPPCPICGTDDHPRFFRAQWIAVVTKHRVPRRWYDPGTWRGHKTYEIHTWCWIAAGDPYWRTHE